MSSARSLCAALALLLCICSCNGHHEPSVWTELGTDGDAPSPSCDFMAAAVGGDVFGVMFGADPQTDDYWVEDDIWEVDLSGEEPQWTLVGASSTLKPPTRVSGNIAYDSTNDVYIIWGGYGFTDSGERYFDDLWTFDRETGQWTEVIEASEDWLSNDGPDSTAWSRGFIWIGDETLFMYGGTTPFEGVLSVPSHVSSDQYFALDTTSWEWLALHENISSAIRPPPLDGSAYVFHDGQVWLWGGYSCSANGSIPTGGEACHPDEMWVLTVNAGGQSIWTQPATENTPQGRAYHTMVVIDDKFYVFGGGYYAADGTWTFHNETLVFDPATSSWETLETTANGPARRWSHSSFALDDGESFIVLMGCNNDATFDPTVYVLTLAEEHEDESSTAGGSDDDETNAAATASASFLAVVAVAAVAVIARPLLA